LTLRLLNNTHVFDSDDYQDTVYPNFIPVLW